MDEGPQPASKNLVGQGFGDECFVFVALLAQLAGLGFLHALHQVAQELVGVLLPAQPELRLTIRILS